jgi:UTP--glucose-1-phosphate uridylyltransferase
LGDSLIGLDGRSDICRRMIAEFESSGADAVIAIQEVPRHEVVQYGIAVPREAAGETFELADLVEKPAVADAPGTLAVAARYVLRPSIFAMLERTEPDRRGEIQLTDALRLLVRDGGRVVGMRLRREEQRYDVGSFETYYQAFIQGALADPQFGPAIRRYLQTLVED